MILDITKSNIFKVDPDIRFAEEWQVPKGTWLEVWRRYKLLGYSQSDIKDYLFVKYARNLEYSTIGRWIVRTEIYGITEPLIKKGVIHADSTIFREWEEDVMKEIVKSIRSGDSSHSKSII